MHIFFNNPLFWLLSVAALPVLVHLFARTRPRERVFSSIFFLRQVIQRQVRVNKPTDWLLLVIRTLAFAALAAAFLLPYMTGERMDEREGARSVMLVIDRSASMGASDGQQSRTGKAGQMAEGIVTSLGPADKINMIWIDSQPSPLFRESSPNKNMVVRELQQIHSRQEEGRVGIALKQAADVMAKEDAGYRKEVYIISDFQESNWKSADTDHFPADTGVHYFSVSQTHCLPNTAITELTMIPSNALPGQKVSVQANIDNFGKETIRTTIHLEAGDLRTSQPCEIGGRSSAVVHFNLKAPSKPGQWIATAGIDNDAFPADDTRSVMGMVSEIIRCDVVATDKAQLGYLVKALDVIPFLKTQTAAGIGMGEPDVVVWNKPQAEDAGGIKALAQKGATVIIVPDFSGDKVPCMLMTAKDNQRAEFEYASSEKGWKLETRRPDDAAFGLFKDAETANPLEGTIFRRLNKGLTDQLAPACQTLVQYEDGVPAIVRRSEGHGTIILWNVPVSWQDSTWGGARNFVPFLGELLLHSRRGDMGYTEPEAGTDHLVFALPEYMNAVDVSLSRNGNESVPLSVSNLERAAIVSEQPALPGIYTWLNNSRVIGSEVVNFPREESDLQTLGDRMPNGSEGTFDQNSIATISTRIMLWPYFLVLAAILLLFETTIGARLMSRSPSSKDGDLPDEPSTPSRP